MGEGGRGSCRFAATAAFDYCGQVANRICLVALLGVLALGVALAGAATNNISTSAGTGTAGFSGDGGAAAAAELNLPFAVAVTADGGYVIAEQGNGRVRRVSPAGVITSAAAGLNAPNGLAETADAGILVTDSNNNRVLRVAPDGTVATVAGTGAAGSGGDGGPATAAQLAFPAGVAVMPDGGYLIADNDNDRVRRVSADGTITTVAGAAAGFSGDDGPAIDAQLNGPAGIASTGDGGYLIADAGNHRIRRVSPGGTITTVAGTGTPGFGGDGGPATAAQLNQPIGVTATPDGGFLIADYVNNRVRRVALDGAISTVAGTGDPGFAGDGAAATAAQLNLPAGVSVTAEGDYLIADSGNHRVRIVDAGDPVAPTQPSQPTAPGAPLPSPVLGTSVNVDVVRGVVLVAVPAAAASSRQRAAQKGLTFVPLTAERQIPVGSFLDTKRGTVRLESATGSGTRTQAGRFSSGLFQVLQSRTRRARGLTELRLKGSSLDRCRTRGAAAGRAGAGGAHAAQLSRRTIRRLRANARGRFRTRGRHSAATVRGTVWITADRCDGTLTTVRRGRVAVRDFRRKRTVSVRAGKSYLARARPSQR